MRILCGIFLSLFCYVYPLPFSLYSLPISHLYHLTVQQLLIRLAEYLSPTSSCCTCSRLSRRTARMGTPKISPSPPGQTVHCGKRGRQPASCRGIPGSAENLFTKRYHMIANAPACGVDRHYPREYRDYPATKICINALESLSLQMERHTHYRPNGTGNHQAA